MRQIFKGGSHTTDMFFFAFNIHNGTEFGSHLAGF